MRYDNNEGGAGYQCARGGRAQPEWRVVRALRADRLQALASVPLFLEYEAMLNRPEQLAVGHRNVAMVDAFLDGLALKVKTVHLFYLWRSQLRDPADEMVLETALNGRVEALITFNVNDFVGAKRFALPILTPVSFLRQLNKEKE